MSTPVVDSRNVTVQEDSQDGALGLAAPTDIDGHPLTITVTGLPDSSKGTVTLASGLAVTVGQILTATELQGLLYDTAPDANGVAGSFEYSVSDGSAVAPGTVTFDITPVNDAPTITALAGDSLVYSAIGSAAIIEQGGNAAIADIDSTDFAGGQLTVAISAGGDATEDVLSILNQGTALGLIGFDGTDVTYGGVVIGTAAGGAGGTPLVVTLNAAANGAAATALVRAITYEDADTTSPTAGARTIGFTLSDGDGGTSATFNTTVTVSPPVIQTLEVRISASNDDAEERVSSGAINVTGPDLELSVDGSNAQLVGMRFTGISIPTGATVTKAYIQFQVDESFSGATTLTIQGQATLNATQFSSSKFNISTRAKTAAAVTWQPDPWPTVGQAGLAQRTVDISPVIQEIIDQGGWVSGNALAIIVTGTGTRTAEAFDGVASAAPLLHIEYSVGGTTPNNLPVVDSTSVTVLEDAQDALLGLAAPTDADGDPLTIKVVGLPDSAKGTVTLASGVAVAINQELTAAELQGLQFDTAPNANGAAGSFVYSVTDGTAIVNGTVALGITPVNDPPTVSLVNAATMISEGTDTSVAIKVADIVVGDDEEGTNSLSLGGADAGLFEIIGTELFLKAGTVLDAAGNSSLDVTVNVNDPAVGATPDDSVLLAIAVTAGNAPPTILNLHGDAGEYSPASGAVVIEQGSDALVQDLDSTDFAGGQLIATISAGGDAAEDVLSIQNQGSGAGQIGFTGGNVTYGGVQIGTSTGGTGGTPLVVTLNSAANEAATSALVRAITYSNADTVSPTVGPRTIDFSLSDGDGGTSSTFSTLVTVAAPAAVPQTLEVRVSASSDDAEERVSSGAINVTGPDLELSVDGSNAQLVGMRFTGITIPNGANITKAYIQFQVDESFSVPTSLTIQGQATVNAAQFTTAKFNISTRAKTAAAVTWQPDPWPTVGDAGLAQRTVDISAVIQEIINQGGWVSGNALAIIVTGSGTRTAEAFDGVASAAPLLHIEYTTGGTGPNNPPVVDSKTVTVIEDAQDALLGLAAPTDPDGDALTIRVVSLPDPSKGIVTLASGVAVTVDQVLTAAQLQGLQFDGALNANGAAGSFIYSVFDGTTTVNGSVVLNITPVNDAPTISGLAGDAFTYTTFGSAAIIDQGGNADVTDVDSADFAGGQLTVTISAGGDPTEDVLSVLNQGTGAGQIGLSGGNVTYGGVLIGTVTGGSGGTTLVVNLNAAATPVATSALVGVITYNDIDSTSPSLGARTIDFRLSDGDGGTSAIFSTTVTVATSPPPPPPPTLQTLEVRISASSDDAEERVSSGAINVTGPDLELSVDGSNAQLVGMRFTGISIPTGATIAKAYIQFQVDEAFSGATSLTIQGQATVNAAQFSTSKFNISTRAKTAAAVSWQPDPWPTVGQAGLAQQTVDISPVIQEIINQGGWVSGNALAIIISGTGTRTAESFDGSAGGAPLLHIEYTLTPNAPPVVESKSVTVLEDAQDALLGLAAPTDADGQALTITVASLPDPAKGVVTLSTGAAVTVGQVLTSAQLQGLQFDAAPNANGAAGTFVYTVSDGIATVNGTVTLGITPVNDAPTVNLTNMVAVLSEGTNTSSAIKVADIVIGDDEEGTNNLTLSGADASLFQIIGTGLFLKAGTTLSESGNPVLDVTVNVDDPTVGATPDASIALAINVTAGNVSPTIDLDANDSSGALGNNYATTFNVGGSAVAIADLDAAIADPDSTQLFSARITLTNAAAGDSLFAGSLPGTISVGAGSSATVLNLTGTASLSDYAAAIKAITFGNSSSSAAIGDRSISVTVNDGTSDSTAAVSTVSVTNIPASNDFKFWAIGDTPYSSAHEAALSQYLNAIPEGVQFVSHIGDIWSGSVTNPTLSQYQNVSNLLQQSSVPVFIVPGDNEYNDTVNPTQSWSYWASTFTYFDQNWQHSFQVNYQTGRLENYSFVANDILFIGINLVGGTIHDSNEWATRSADDLAWIQANFGQFGSQVGSAVIFAQASPNRSGYTNFKNGLINAAQDFSDPILFVQGDSHKWLLDKPYSTAPNFTRVIIDSTGTDAAPLLVTVSNDPTNPFSFDHDFGVIV